MRALRTHYDDEAEFVRRVDEVQRPEGYRSWGRSRASAASRWPGFRELNNLAWGHVVYVDDLSTHPDGAPPRPRAGAARWCAEEAERLGCDAAAPRLRRGGQTASTPTGST